MRPALGRNLSFDTNITPDVPMETRAELSVTAPMPQAAAALSPPPPATTGRFGMPQALATAGVRRPVASVPS